MTVSTHMQRTVTREEMAAMSALKWFRELVESYRGSPEGFKNFLLARVSEKELHADEILAASYDNTL